MAEVYAYHEKRFQQASEKFGSSVRRRMLIGVFKRSRLHNSSASPECFEPRNSRKLLAARHLRYSNRPSASEEAFEALDVNEQNLRPSFTNPSNMTGLPALSVPCGFTSVHLPMALQIVTRPFEEASVPCRLHIRAGSGLAQLQAEALEATEEIGALVP
jgi:aspartyl-tRNA(Asn)/glutamyl-tRNA(Gln) amidotransferase subunit A